MEEVRKTCKHESKTVKPSNEVFNTMIRKTKWMLENK